MLCDREREIEAFTPQEYWTLDIKLKKGKTKLPTVGISRIDGKKLARNADEVGDKNYLTLKTETDAEKIAADLTDQKFTVTAVKNGQRKKSPAPPFTTSSLQQDASHKLNFKSKIGTVRTLF